MSGWKRWAALAALVLNAGLAASYVALWVRDQADTPRRYGDFAAFYTAWSMVRAGEGARLYDFVAQERHQRQVVPERAAPGNLLPYLNPPPVALTFAPLAALSIDRAAIAWTVGQLALLGLLLRLLWRLWRERPPLERAVLVSAVLAAPPLLLTFSLGTFSLLVLVALLAMHGALAAGREQRAGLWLTMGLVKPQLVLLPAVGLLAGRRWRALAVAGAVGLVAAAVTTAVLGLAVWPGFLATVGTVHRSFERLGIYPEAMFNLSGALLLLIGPPVRALLPAIGLVGLGLGLAATVWIWRGPWRPDEPAFDLRLGATLLLGMFTNLHLYPQDGLLLVGAAVLLDSYLHRAGRPRTPLAVVALAAPVLWFATELLFRMDHVRVPVLLALVLGAAMARELGRNERAPAADLRRSP